MWTAPPGSCHWKTRLQLPPATASFPDADSLEKESDWPSLGGGMLGSTVTGRPVVVVMRGGSREGGLR